MAANLSARKRVSLVLATPASSLGNAVLQITSRCGHVGWLRVADLAVYGREITLAEGLRKLRCSACGRSPVRVVLALRYPPQREDEAQMLVVWG